MNTTNKQGKKVKIKIRAEIEDMTSENPIYLPQENEDRPYEECIEFSTEGTVFRKGDTIEIVYKENEELGMANIESTLRFKKSKPTMVNLIRRGAAPTSLIFDKDVPRRNCAYSIGNIPFNFCICTNNVINIFDEEGGKIVLDYLIEINGMKNEHNTYILEYRE